MTNKKRIFSLILALLMIVTSLPLSVFANSNEKNLGDKELVNGTVKDDKLVFKVLETKSRSPKKAINQNRSIQTRSMYSDDLEFGDEIINGPVGSSNQTITQKVNVSLDAKGLNYSDNMSDGLLTSGLQVKLYFIATGQGDTPVASKEITVPKDGTIDAELDIPSGISTGVLYAEILNPNDSVNIRIVKGADDTTETNQVDPETPWDFTFEVMEIVHPLIKLVAKDPYGQDIRVTDNVAVKFKNGELEVPFNLNTSSSEYNIKNDKIFGEDGKGDINELNNYDSNNAPTLEITGEINNKVKLGDVDYKVEKKYNYQTGGLITLTSQPKVISPPDSNNPGKIPDGYERLIFKADEKEQNGTKGTFSNGNNQDKQRVIDVKSGTNYNDAEVKKAIKGITNPVVTNAGLGKTFNKWDPEVNTTDGTSTALTGLAVAQETKEFYAKYKFIAEPSYEEVEGTIGQKATVNPKFKKGTTEVAMPTGTTFTLDTTNQVRGATVDSKTGIVTYTPVAADSNKTLTIPVKVTYTDGTHRVVDAKIRVGKSTADTIKELGGLKGVDLAAWVGDTLDANFWKKGVAANTADADKKAKVDAALAEAKVEDTTATKRTTTAKGTFPGTLKVTFKDGSVYEVEAAQGQTPAKTDINQTLYVYDKGDKKPDPQPGGKETPVPDGTIFVEFTRDEASIKEDGFKNLKPLMYANGDSVTADKFPDAKAADGYKEATVTWTPAKENAKVDTNNTEAYKEATKTFTFKASATKESTADVVKKNGGLKGVDLAAWVGDTLDANFWKKGVAANTADADKKAKVDAALAEAKVEDTTATKRTTTAKGTFPGTLKVTFKDGSVYEVEAAQGQTPAKTDINQTLYVYDKGDKKPDPQPGGKETPVPDGTIFVEFTRDEASIKEDGFKNLKPLMYANGDSVTADKFPDAKAADGYKEATVTWTPAKENAKVDTNNTEAYKEATKTFTFKASATKESTADKDNYDPHYEDKTGVPGEKVVIPAPTFTDKDGKKVDKPTDNSTTPAKDTTFAKNDKTQTNVTVDPKTGEVTVQIPDDAKVGTEIKVPVDVTYPDGSNETVEVKVIVGEDKTTPQGPSVTYPDTNIDKGDTKKVTPDIKGKDGKPAEPDKTPEVVQPGNGLVVTPHDDGSITVTVPKDYDGPDTITVDVTVKVNGEDVKTKLTIRVNNGNDDGDYVIPGIKYRDHKVPTYPVYVSVPVKPDTLWYIFYIDKYDYEEVRNNNSTSHKMDVTPVIRNDRTMLPLRYVAEAIGADVKWDPETRTATFAKDGLIATIQIDSDEIVLSNGKTVKMDSKPLNINDRILVSVVNVGNVFGLTNGNTLDGVDQDIEWDHDTRTATIYIRR